MTGEAILKGKLWGLREERKAWGGLARSEGNKKGDSQGNTEKIVVLETERRRTESCR